MENRWMNAFVKTIITIVVLHILFLILGLYAGSGIGWFGWPMIWPHWHGGLNATLAIIAGIVLYFAIYAFWSGRADRGYKS
ncbi:MAG: hypothetical protein GX663_10195 [Clostridiales bacterium]|nr:hypothetical protein [Clostridiales bacterium]